MAVLATLTSALCFQGNRLPALEASKPQKDGGEMLIAFGGPERLAMGVGQSIDCLGHARLFVGLGSEWQVPH